jgi:hypothetical protein
MRSSELECALLALDEMQAQRDEARMERDQARREVCALEADTTEDQLEYAKQRGWDCHNRTGLI